MKRAGFDPASHSGKALLNILENYPRTELFQAETDVLYDSAMAILQLEERPRVRALPRRDRFDRFVSVLVFVPRDRYTSDLRERIGLALAELYDGRVSAFFPDFSMTHLTRVQFIIGRNPGEGPDPAQDEIEARSAPSSAPSRTISLEALNAAHPPERVAEILPRLCQRIRLRLSRRASRRRMRFATSRSPSGSRRTTSRCASSAGRAMPETRVVMSFHHLGDPIPLSRRVPLLENLGFSVVNERTYRIARSGGPPLYRHDMTLVRTDGEAFDLAHARRLHDAVARRLARQGRE